MTSDEEASLKQWVLGMAEASALYAAQTTSLGRRKIVKGILSGLIADLMVLPGFADSGAHFPLKDLHDFLNDLDRGRDHPWSVPFSVSGTSEANTSQVQLKAWVRFAHKRLVSVGISPTDAFRHIAQGLSANGYTSGGGRDLSWRTVQSWCRSIPTVRDQPEQDRVDQIFGQAWAGVAALIAVERPNLAQREIAKLIVDQLWSMPNLRTVASQPD